MTRIHVVGSARNAAPWLDAMLESLVAQTHADWVLHLRDDGSTDDTWEILTRWRAREPRIADLVRGESSLGSVQGFASMLQRVPEDAEAVALADADDVWLPMRLERTLAALRDAQQAFAGPILVHSDVRVVDAELREIAPSLWGASRMHVDDPSVHMQAIHNVAIGPTHLFNGALLPFVRTAPPEVKCHDWWIALVAAARGRLVAVHEPTVLYRRHGSNATGLDVGRFAVMRKLRNSVRAVPQLRRHLAETAAQASALLREHGAALSPRDRSAIARLAGIPSQGGLRRRIAIARGRWHPRHGLLRNLGMVLRG